MRHIREGRLCALMLWLTLAMVGWAFAQPPAEPALQLDKFAMKPAAGPADRVETPLGGVWEVGRWREPEVISKEESKPIVNRTQPIDTLPEAGQVAFAPAKVPGPVPPGTGAASNAHRIIERTHVTVPAELDGRAFVLRLPSFSMIASVFVNGKYCGGNDVILTQWDCDVTKAIKPGADNEIVVAIKDMFYALVESEKNAWIFTVPKSMYDGHSQGVGMGSDYPIMMHPESGLLATPVLVALGQVYTSDAFAIPSVQKKQLGLEITLFNASGADAQVTVENEVVPKAGGAAEKKFATLKATVPAGKESEVLKATEPWDNAKLWWPAEPNLYNLVTRVSLNGKVVDTKVTTFGFREWQWDSVEFKLNGIPWHMWADIYPGTGTPENAMKTMKAHGQTMYRFWGQEWCGLEQEATLDFMDQSGMPVRRSGIFDGEYASYNWWDRNPNLWDNVRKSLRAQVKNERNHPSIFVWSMENEITFINSRNLGQLKNSDPQVKKCAEEVMGMDPTRPVMVDGGNALSDESLPVNGCHYLDPEWNDLPDAAYSLDFFYNVGPNSTPPSTWTVAKNKPILLGESFFANGFTPGAFAQVMGDTAFLGRGESGRGVAIVAKMYSEGYRYAKVYPHYWFYVGENQPYYNSWQPIAALVREWNATFASGQAVKRSARVFNDTHLAKSIAFAWQVKMGEKVVKDGSQKFDIAPGTSQDTEIAFDVPSVKERTPAQLVLTCSTDGKEVFKDTKPLAFFGPGGAPAKSKLAAADLAVLDPNGSVKDRLKKRGIAFTDVAAYEQLPEKAQVVVIGKDAMTGKADDGRLGALAQAGARVLVLEQSEPLAGASVPGVQINAPDNRRRGGGRPADAGPRLLTAGRIAFAQAMGHPAFAGLEQSDLSMWAGDHVVYRGPYFAAPTGAQSLVQCYTDLSYTAIASTPVGPGLVTLCQMVVGEKLASEPVAQVLFDNLLNYSADYKLVQKSLAVSVDPDSPRGKLLAATSAKFDQVADPVAALSDGKHEIVVADATPETLAKIAAAQDKVKAFTAKGGWLMLWGVDEKGLADFNKIVGVNHLIRPFEMEKVYLPEKRDLLMTGLTQRDVAMAGEKMNSWSADTFAATDVFTNVVDLDDIAPFCTFPKPADLNLGEAAPMRDHWPRNIVNGFTTADSWRLCLSLNYGEGCPTKITLTLPREEEIAEVSAIFNALYGKVTKFQLVFDGKEAEALKFDAQPNDVLQTFKVEPARKAKTVTLDIADWVKHPKTPVVGFDNVWIKVKRSDEFNKKVVPLLNLGALVKYPMGQGGVVLNELNVKDDAKSANEAKKRSIVATMLRNMGAVFAAGAAPAAAPAEPQK